MSNQDREEQRATHELAERLMSDREGRPVEAAVVAASMLEANPADLMAWLLLARALEAGADHDRAQRAFQGVTSAYAARGDLPMAIAAMLDIKRFDPTAARELLEDLALSFSASSPGLDDDWRPAPPPMPQHPAVELALAGDRQRAEALIDGALEAAETRPTLSDPGSENRFFPLFSSLSPAAFIRFAERLHLERVTPDAVILEQGAPGDGFFVVARGEVRVVRRRREGEEQLLARLGAGAFFGEMAIVTRAPRAAEVRASTLVTVLRADMAELEAEMSRTPEIRKVLAAFCRARMLQNVVSASPVLRRVPAAERWKVLERFTERSQAKGEVLIHEGNESEGLFLLISGEVGGDAPRAGRHAIDREVGSGRLFW